MVPLSAVTLTLSARLAASPAYRAPAQRTATHSDYYSPMIASPREVFCGFNHVNVRDGVNARFKCEALSWNERSVDMKIPAWEQESAYHNMGASYIALL